MAIVLGINVDPGLLARWRGWFAPELQPFPTDKLDEQVSGELAAAQPLEPSAEVRDTFQLYGAPQLWLREHDFARLPRRTRRALLSGREATGRVSDHSAAVRALAAGGLTDSRIVWWPSLLRDLGDEPLLAYLNEGVRPSRHRDVTSATWAAAERTLPGAARLAGTFPTGSGPNCFGTVMAAVGVAEAESVWMMREPFEAWLTERARPTRGTGWDHLPGLVLVWRDAAGLATHAALTIGDSYCLSKPSQAWCSPRLVWTTRETIEANTYRGQTLTRYVLAASVARTTQSQADKRRKPKAGAGIVERGSVSG